MGVGRADDRHTRLDGEPDVLVAEVEAIGQSVRLDRLSMLLRDCDHFLVFIAHDYWRGAAFCPVPDWSELRRYVPDLPPLFSTR